MATETAMRQEIQRLREEVIDYQKQLIASQKQVMELLAVSSLPEKSAPPRPQKRPGGKRAVVLKFYRG